MFTYDLDDVFEALALPMVAIIVGLIALLRFLGVEFYTAFTIAFFVGLFMPTIVLIPIRIHRARERNLDA